jgi:hypothetical protein
MASPPKDQKLDSKTVAYEFRMLCCTASCLPSVDPKTEWVLYNALVESFALHCRNFLAFFFGHDPASGFNIRSNDVLATDFCPSWSEPWDATLFGLAKEQASKHVAHIVTERQDVNFPGGPVSVWDIPSLVPAFIKLMERFLVGANNLDPKMEKLLRGTVAEFKSPPPSSPHTPPSWMTGKTAPPDS